MTNITPIQFQFRVDFFSLDLRGRGIVRPVGGIMVMPT